MLKILTRVLIVLLAAGLVIGATYAISLNTTLNLTGEWQGGLDGERPDFSALPQTDSEQAQGDLAGKGGRGEPGVIPQDGSAAGTTAVQPGDGFRGGSGEREGGSAFGWSEVLKSLGVIALVTAVIVIVQKVYAWLRRPRKPAAPAPSGA